MTRLAPWQARAGPGRRVPGERVVSALCSRTGPPGKQIAGREAQPSHSDAARASRRCAPANHAPKGANPEKISHARGALRLCPPHTGPARVEPGAGGHRGGEGRAPEWSVKPGDLSPICSTSLSLLCLRTGRNISPEVQRVLRVILRIGHAFTRDCAGFIRYLQLALCFRSGIQLLCNRQKGRGPAPPGV